MVNHKEILRLKKLGLTNREIADAAGCGRNTVTRTLARAREQQLGWAGSKRSPCRSKKSHRIYFHSKQRVLPTRCRITNGYTERCRRAALP